MHSLSFPFLPIINTPRRQINGSTRRYRAPTVSVSSASTTAPATVSTTRAWVQGSLHHRSARCLHRGLGPGLPPVPDRPIERDPSFLPLDLGAYWRCLSRDQKGSIYKQYNPLLIHCLPRHGIHTFMFYEDLHMYAYHYMCTCINICLYLDTYVDT